ncbi:KAP family P-loop NTPase fold protein [Paraburkholderia sediminicola]|uniref:KAP family P-loop NTPase fold protein n=1 Tax=Paraburkholderia sediminicola TaxID=458836 RepID=UPI0038BAADE8
MSFSDEHLAADAAGHDAPVTHVDADFYDRWPIASAIADTIFSAPETWSTRIGVFGQWGEGKTSVLRLLEKALLTRGAVTVWFSAWDADGHEADFWARFTQALVEGFEEAELPLTIRSRLRALASRHLLSVLQGAAVAAQLKSVKVPDALVTQTHALLQKYLHLGRHAIGRMLATARAKRVVVVIDDLDRANPQAIPQILMAVRELLDIPGFAFVLAFDPSVVEKSLAANNAAWNVDGQRFIDKIIDFGFPLLRPDDSSIRRLAIAEFSRLCPFVPVDALRIIVDAVPDNPRKLKLFARTVSSYSKESGRHAPEELNWNIVLLLTLMRIEDDAFTRKFLSVVTAGGFGLGWELAAGSRTEREQRKKERESELLKDVAEQAVADRLRKILVVWDKQTELVDARYISYQAWFAIRPDSITWAEFDAFVKTWKAGRERDLVTRFVEARADATKRRLPLVAEEFLRAVTLKYGSILDRAGTIGDQKQHAQCIAEAEVLLDLYAQAFDQCAQTHGFFDNADRLAALRSLIQTRGAWAHFTMNPGEKELREAEETLVVGLAKTFDDPLAVFEGLGLGMSEESSHLASSAAAYNLTRQLREVIEPLCVEQAIALFRSSDGVVGIAGLKERPALHYILSSPSSSFFEEEHQEAMTAVLADAVKHSHVAANAELYLQRLLSYGDTGDPYLSQADRQAFLLEHAAMLRHLWTAAVQRPRQFRFLQSLRDQRSALIRAGIDEAELIEPDWLRPG